MSVKRIVPIVATERPAEAAAFYGDMLGLSPIMDLGWIVTYAVPGAPGSQISFAQEGGSGAPVPDISVEVDDLDAALARMRAAGHAVEYGPVDEPWGVRRFFVRDPFGRLVNVVTHR